MTAGRIPIIIDTDPGQDDAVAILLACAHPGELDLRAVTAVAGNVPVGQATANVLRILDLAGREDAPVHRGAEAPLIYPLETAEFVCGPDGLTGADLPVSSRRASPGHAAEALVAALRAAPARSVTLCALGPLTNLALAFRLAPDALGHVERIVLMGGALGLGNMTPAAEFNAYVDPHAAAIVFGAGVPIVMFGLHATHQAVPNADEMARLAALGGRSAAAAHGMMTRPRAGGLGTAGHPMHDPLVIAWLLWPDLFQGRDCFVEVETGAGSQRGRTTIDWHGRLKRPPNAFVVDAVDARGFFARLIGSLARLP
ncbi:nucleoside hydrolase [Alsobacter sp. SYSU BS001988]